jgi:hypothetical protein
MAKTQHRAFSLEYPSLRLELITEVDVYPVSTNSKNHLNSPVKINAVWDTGAIEKAEALT